MENNCNWKMVNGRKITKTGNKKERNLENGKLEMKIETWKKNENEK